MPEWGRVGPPRVRQKQDHVTNFIGGCVISCNMMEYQHQFWPGCMLQIAK